MSKSIKELEGSIKYSFKNKDLLHKALTHKSFNSDNNNEKLEFLGDRVLGLVISKKLLEKYKVIEITLRSHDALETAIKLKEQNPDINIGLGSIKSLKVFEEVTNFKFDFYVSPGTNIKMLDFAKKNQFLFIPGVSTPSEILTAIEYDCNILKYFHAEKNGGAKSLNFLDEKYLNYGLNLLKKICIFDLYR